jgi:hypothetical protein
VAAEFLVMNFQVGHCTAELASPAVAAQHLLTEVVVQNGVQPHSGMLWQNPIHDTFWVAWRMNASFSSLGRNLKNREMDCKSTSEFPFSRFAPARKSAQIISRQ